MRPGISRKHQRFPFLFHDDHALFFSFPKTPPAILCLLHGHLLDIIYMPVVDSYMNVFSLNVARYPLNANSTDDPMFAPIEQALVTLGIHGVDIGVLMQPLPYLWDHSYMLDALSQYGDRFIGIAHLDPEDSSSAKKLKSFSSAGIQGIQLYGSVLGNSLSARTTLALCDQAASMNAPVCLQIRSVHLSAVEQLASSLPEVTFIVSQDATAPSRIEDWTDILALSQFGNVFLGLFHFSPSHIEGAAVSHGPAFAIKAVDCFGADRLLWGSSFPAALAQGGYQGALDFMRTGIPNLNDADLSALLGGTAGSIWRLPAGRVEAS